MLHYMKHYIIQRGESTLINKLSKLLVIILLISTVFGLSGCSFLHKSRQVQLEPILEVTSAPEEELYKTVTVKRGSKREKKEVVFVLSTMKRKKLYFHTTGLEITKVLVKEGSLVKKGDVLAQLDLEDLEDNLESCNFQTKSKYLELIHDKKLLRIKERRVPFIDEKERNGFQKEIETLQDDIEELQKTIAMLKEQRKENEEAKRKRYIYAPMYGYIRKLQVDRYQGVSNQQDVFAEIYSDTMVFQNISSKRYPFRKGQGIVVTIGKVPYHGTITSMKKDNRTSERTTTIQLDTNTQFAEGTLATIWLPGKEFKNQLYVNAKAVVTWRGQTYVKSLDEYGFKQLKKVITGDSINGYMEIKSGVKEGEKLVLD